MGVSKKRLITAVAAHITAIVHGQQSDWEDCFAVNRQLWSTDYKTAQQVTEACLLQLLSCCVTVSNSHSS